MDVVSEVCLFGLMKYFFFRFYLYASDIFVYVFELFVFFFSMLKRGCCQLLGWRNLFWGGKKKDGMGEFR